MAVGATMRNGTVIEMLFATAPEAGMCLYQLPYLMTVEPDGDDVVSMILSPLQEIVE